MKNSIHRGIVVSILSFLFGILFFNYFLDFFQSLYIIIFLSIILANMFLYKEKTYLFFSFLFLVFSFLGSLYSYNFYSEFTNNYTKIEKYFYFNTLALEGKVLKLEKIKDNSKIYLLQVHMIDKKPIESSLYGLIEVPFNVSLHEYQNVHFQSKIYQINNFSKYNYKLFLASQNIFFRAYPVDIDSRGDIKKNNVIQYILNIRKKILISLEALYPKEESILLGGMLIGARENIPKNLSDDFNNAGLTHIIAVSGYNITILILFCSFLLSFLPFSLRIIGILLFLLFFILLVGYNPPVVRAGIMGFLGFLLLHLGRKPSIFMLLLFSVIIMLLFNPFSLSYDISFQLSFLAVIGVVYFGDILKKIFSFLPSFFVLKESLILTLSALIFTLPLSLFYFGQLSLVAPISNVLVAPTIPFIMLFGFLSLLSSYVFLPVSYIFSYVTYLFLKLDISFIHFFGGLPLSVLKIPNVDILFYIACTYYIFLFSIIYTQKKE